MEPEITFRKLFPENFKILLDLFVFWINPHTVAGIDRSNELIGSVTDSTFFKNYGVNPFIDTEDDQLSTFAMDVDTAAYTVARRFVSDGYFPDPDSVRVEEFINYFKQEYEPPTEDVFAIRKSRAFLCVGVIGFPGSEYLLDTLV